MKFNFFMPTKVISGEDCIVQNSEAFKAFGKKAVIVCGKHSAEASGALSDICKAIKKNQQDFCIYNKIMSNPTIPCVYDGAEFAKSNGADFVIAIGGGSPMDAAKAISLTAAQNIPPEQLFNSSEFTDKILPLVFVPTTAGTGSEVTQYSILTNDTAQTKTSIASQLIFPKIAFIDGKYTESLSKKTTVNTAIDALSHAIEGILSVRAGTISDALAFKSIEMIASCFESLKKGKLSKEQRTILIEASTMAGMVIAQTGTTSVHVMGYSLTYFKDIDHGRANGLLLGKTLKFIEKKNPELIKKILMPLNMSCDKFQAVLDELLGEKEKLTEEEILKFTEKASKNKNLCNGKVPPNKDDIYMIYKTSFQL